MTEPVSFVDEGLGNSSYLLDLGDGRAVAIDPTRDVGKYLMAAERHGLDIAFTAETHLHADFLSGGRELAAFGATVFAPAAAGLEWPHRGFRHGDDIDLGGLCLRAIATPGHTPEHVSWLLLDGGRPVGLFSGGALLVGAVARTDLISAERTEPLARSLWQSLQESVLSLPDDVVVYPTHGAGSFCAATPTGARTTTIGCERASNPLLRAQDEDAFVRMLLGGYGSYPPYFLRLRERNRRGPHVLGWPLPSLPGLDVGEVCRHLDAGALLLDTRPVRSWAHGHPPAALAIPLRPQFGSWLGWLVDDDRPLIFLVDSDEDLAEIARQALTIGYERLLGALAGGMGAWRAAGLPAVATELLPAPPLDRSVVDVRQCNEYETGHVPGALHVELGTLARAHAGLPEGPLAVMCAHGERAATAASLLEQVGRDGVAVVVGGPEDWSRPHGRLETGG